MMLVEPHVAATMADHRSPGGSRFLFSPNECVGRCDRIIVICNRRIVQVGSPDELDGEAGLFRELAGTALPA